MSKISLEGNVSGSGTLTIAAPNTNSNFTLSLPTNTGTIITQNSTPAFASTIGVGGATAAASGAGITFPATQSASSDANTLDDYEEGTFTVSLSPSTGALTTSSSSGNYIKIGKLVYVHISILITTVGTASGYLNFTGLPFSVQNSGGSGQIPLIVRETANTGTMYGGFLGNSATDGRLHGFADSTTTINMSNGNRYNIAACYAVA